MKVVESAPDEEQLALIDGAVAEAAPLLQIDLDQHSAAEIIAKVNEAIVALALGQPTPMAGNEDAPVLLGALWGSQLKRQFNWYWADVVVDDEFPEVAIISPQRELIAFPFSFVGVCIERQCICTIALAFNMLLAGTVPLEPGAYYNLMLDVHHIIPPYELPDSE